MNRQIKKLLACSLAITIGLLPVLASGVFAGNDSSMSTAAKQELQAAESTLAASTEATKTTESTAPTSQSKETLTASESDAATTATTTATETTVAETTVASSSNAASKYKNITVRYEATAGGKVTPASETVKAPLPDSSDENNELKDGPVSGDTVKAVGSTALSDDGCYFVNWTNENGEIVSEENTFAPDVNSDKETVIFTANFAAAAIKGTASYEGVTINVNAPTGAFPAGTTLEITPIGSKNDDEELSGGNENTLKIKDTILNALYEENQDNVLKDFVAFDINFYSIGSDGSKTKVEPAEGKKVSVKFSVLKDSIHYVDDNNKVDVYHVTENLDDATKLGGDEAKNGNNSNNICINGDTKEIEVQANEFTPAVLTEYESTDLSETTLNEDSEIGAPGHHKTIKENSDGKTYKITLDATGDSDSETQYTPMDILFVVDCSTSMTWNMTGSTTSTKADQRINIVRSVINRVVTKIEGLNKNLAEADKTRLGLITFNSEVRTNSDFSTDFSNIKADNSYVTETGTNWSAAMNSAVQKLSNNELNHKRYLIFLSDGEPNRPKAKGKTPYSQAVTSAKDIPSDTTKYTVAVGKDAGIEKMGNFATDIGATNYKAADSSSLVDAFNNIFNSILHTYANVTITDNLTDYAECTGKTIGESNLVVKNGSKVLETKDYTIVENTAKKISIKLNGNLTTGNSFNISFDVKPSLKAYQTFIKDNGSYADGLGTTEGYYTNTSAQVGYQIVTSTTDENNQKTETYGDTLTDPYAEKPVMPVTTASLAVSKNWNGETGHSNDTVVVGLKTSDGEIVRTDPTDENSAQVTATLNAANNFSTTINNLIPESMLGGKTYTVNEISAVTGSGTSATDITSRYTALVSPRNGNSISITNTRNTASITVKKIIAGDPGARLNEANFKIQVNETDAASGTSNPTTIQTLILTPNTSGTGTAEDPYSWEVSGLKVGAHYDFVESGDSIDNYTLTRSAQDGTITVGDFSSTSGSITFTNTYTRVTGTLNITKTFSSSDSEMTGLPSNFKITVTETDPLNPGATSAPIELAVDSLTPRSENTYTWSIEGAKSGAKYVAAESGCEVSDTDTSSTVATGKYYTLTTQTISYPGITSGTGADYIFTPNAAAIPTIALTNVYTRKTAKLFIKKVIGTNRDSANLNQEFNFTLNLKNYAEQNLIGTFGCEYTGSGDHSSATRVNVTDGTAANQIKLKDNQQIEIRDLPMGSKFAVVETQETGYDKPVYSLDTASQMSLLTGDTTVTVTNNLIKIQPTGIKDNLKLAWVYLLVAIMGFVSMIIYRRKISSRRR